MTTQTIGRKWLETTIAEMEVVRDDMPFGLDEDGNNTLAALKIALAALGIEPVYQVNDGVGSHTWSDVAKDVFDLYSDQRKRIAYAAPPAPAPEVDDIGSWDNGKYPPSHEPAPAPVNDVTSGESLTVTLPDISSKAFWSGSGKGEVFHPETYKRWVKEAIERACAIAGIVVEVK
ncbi:hypothetical protein GA0061070_104927 [Kosakonia oryziphila]|uniref:Uncharacterized protein n=1 Tax=Kosakonia oryziphila TaxID=1005667 RepID=A0A1C4G1Z0_9ENTR|nr:hypothetical protein GA0061070_104927 [Kosakonia oryziphila]